MSSSRMKSKYDGKIAGLYDLEESIGKGHYAVVKVARHVFTGEKVAVKVIDKNRLDEVSRANLFQEVRCMKLVQHPNVVRLYEVIDTQTKLYLVLELGDGGDLYDYIMKQHHGLSEQEASFCFAQIVDAISYCHQLHVVHRDLKPENVIFFTKSKKVKLTDFGFSNRFVPGRKLDTSCGSLAYSAPEILLGDAYDAPAVDVWSLGVILYMLVCGKPPFQEANDSETLIRIMDCHYVTPEHVSAQCVELLRGMLQRDPTKRMTMPSISQHPWLSLSHVPRQLATPLVSSNGVSNNLLCHINNKTKASSMLVSMGTLTDDEHGCILKKMVDGQIASRDEIIRCLESDAYNHVTSTYYLLAERLLRKRNQHQQTNGQLSTGSPSKNTVHPRSTITNGVCSTDHVRTSHVPAPVSPCPVGKVSSPVCNGNSKPCLVIEELSEEETDESVEDKKKSSLPSAFNLKVQVENDEVKQIDILSPSKQARSVLAVPQLILNQISEEEEDDECNTHSYAVDPRPMNPHGSHAYLNEVPLVLSAIVDNGQPAATRRSDACSHYDISDDDDDDDDYDDDDDIAVLGGHHGLRHEICRQSSLCQTSHTDCEPVATLPYTGTTNSLDRRLFRQQRRLTKSSSTTGRSIVGAVKKSVSMILGHFAVVGDVTAKKPLSVDTWGSCGNLSQQTTKTLVDRHRSNGCQLARELRRNRSEHEASSDMNKTWSSSSNVIRVRSRDFSTLVSKFTTHIAP